jgi:hypothetical protein
MFGVKITIRLFYKDFSTIFCATMTRGPCQAQGLKRRLALTLPQMYVAPMLIARSDMIATLMEGLIAASGRAHELCVLDRQELFPPAGKIRAESITEPAFALCINIFGMMYTMSVWMRFESH